MHLQRRPSRFWWLVLLGISALVARPWPASRASSEECAFEESRSPFSQGSVSVRFSHVTTMQGNQNTPLKSVTVQLDGSVTLTVDAHGIVSEASGQATFTMKGSGTTGGILASNLSGQYSVDLKLGSFDPRVLRLLGSVSGEGFTVNVAGPTAKGKVEARGAGSTEIKLYSSGSGCPPASGRFDAWLVDESLSSLRSAGYTGEPGSSTWEVGGQDKSKDTEELRDFRKRLDEATKYGGPLSQRRIISQRLGKLMKEVREKHPSDALGACMWKDWLKAAHQVLNRWIDEDLPGLKSYQGDIAGLESKIGRIIESERQILVLGLDRCSPEHERIWGEIQAALEKALMKAYADERPADMLRLMRGISVFGEIEPKLHERCWEMLKKIAKEQLDASLANLKAVKAPLDCTNVAFARAAGQALFAARQALIVGGDYDESQKVIEYLGQVARKLDWNTREGACLGIYQ